MKYVHTVLGFIILFFGLLSCESSTTKSVNRTHVKDTATQDIKVIKPVPSVNTTTQKSGVLTERQLDAMPDSAFVELLVVDSSFVLDMKYATADNFLKNKVYDCDKCLLRVNVAIALAKAQKIFLARGYQIKLYDCYRPLDVQKRMWEIMPNNRYVGNPYGNGSVHNKGAAVDLTLVNAQGEELDMGTPFDHFGREAHHAFRELPEEVLRNRKFLKQVMEEAGFQPITSEWWHYSHRKNNYPVANFKPDC